MDPFKLAAVDFIADLLRSEFCKEQDSEDEEKDDHKEVIASAKVKLVGLKTIEEVTRHLSWVFSLPKGSKVKNTDGEEGVYFGTHPEHPAHAIVLIPHIDMNGPYLTRAYWPILSLVTN